MSDSVAKPAREHTLLSTADAQVWAQEFCRIFDGFYIRSGDDSDGVIDEGTMIGWFANAMATGEWDFKRRATVTAHQDTDGVITVPDELADQILITREILLEMIEQHNRSLGIEEDDDDLPLEMERRKFIEGFEEGRPET